MSDSTVNSIGKLKVTVRFQLPVSDLAHYEAENLHQAAMNLVAWYADGSADVYSDVSMSPDNMDIVVVVANKA